MVWTAPEITRVIRPLDVLAGDERTLADAWLNLHRQTLLWKCGGLTAEQLKLRAATDELRSQVSSSEKRNRDHGVIEPGSAQLMAPSMPGQVQSRSCTAIFQNGGDHTRLRVHVETAE